MRAMAYQYLYQPLLGGAPALTPTLNYVGRRATDNAFSSKISGAQAITTYAFSAASAG